MFVYEYGPHDNRPNNGVASVDVTLTNLSNLTVTCVVRFYAFNNTAGAQTPSIYGSQIITLSPFGNGASTYLIKNVPTATAFFGVKVSANNNEAELLRSVITFNNALSQPVGSIPIPLISSMPKYAYIVNSGDDTLLVIDQVTKQQVGGLIQLPLSSMPVDVALPYFSIYAFTANSNSLNDSLILTDTRQLGLLPIGKESIAIDTDEPYAIRVFALNNDSPNSYVTVFDITTNTQRPGSPITVGDNAVALQFVPSTERLYVANKDDGTISVINTITNTVITTIPLLPGVPNASAPVHLAASSNGKYIYVAAQGLPGEIQVIDGFTNTMLTPIPLLGIPSASGLIPYRIALSPDDAALYVASANSSDLVSLNVHSPAKPALYRNVTMTGGPPEALAVTPDGSEVYIVNNWSSGSTVSILDRSTNSLLPVPIPTGFQPKSISFSNFIW
ncbi:YncE family protein [Paenibacillus sp. UMB4589-SE434]|uniref:YncE family protein n=1 Tax=Paenibacillus sp. UMB4589-SE434 TaxID=3046314 RepID=UPI00254F30C9|nr:YncE family protein [Paenibacillus sp. UMB4589-SE434]MDK8182439.1 YncE family protein [Paenibacillus sp. UMB4589-SE434]